MQGYTFIRVGTNTLNSLLYIQSVHKVVRPCSAYRATFMDSSWMDSPTNLDGLLLKDQLNPTLSTLIPHRFKLLFFQHSVGGSFKDVNRYKGAIRFSRGLPLIPPSFHRIPKGSRFIMTRHNPLNELSLTFLPFAVYSTLYLTKKPN